MKIILITLIIVLIAGTVQAAVLDNLWKGIIAEAVSEGYQGMYAVACCVRNRINAGMTTGLVALRRKDLDEFIRREGRQAEHIAKDIIKKVFEENSPDVTGGATHYENVEAYGVPAWVTQGSMVKTIKNGRHTFYKQRRSR